MKMAIVGCGGRGRIHAQALAGLDSVQVACVADPDAENARKVCEEFLPHASQWPDYRAMLTAESPEAVVIALWTGFHLPVFRDCVDAGVKLVLCEKPMAPTWSESVEMSRLAEESGVMLVFSHQRRFAKGNLLVRKLIAEGKIGDLERMELYSPPNILDCGTHTFDQAMSFMNESPAKWVLGAVDASQPISWFNVEADCVATGQVVFANGVRASLQFGGPDLDIWGGVRVTGSKGFIEVFWDGEIKRMVVYDDPSFVPPAVGEDSHEAHMKAYCADAFAAFLEGREPETSHRRALQAAEIVFAFYLSAQRRARVELPIPESLGNPFHEMLESGELDEARRLGMAVAAG